MKRRLSNRSMRFHLVAAFVGLTLLASMALLLVAEVSARRYLREQLRQKLMAIAAQGAATVDGDLLRRIKSRADETSPGYLEVKRGLQQLRDGHNGIRYVYTMRPNADPRRWRFVVDAEEDPRLVSHVGDTHDVTGLAEMRKGVHGPAADYAPTKDAWGSWLSAYAPVRDERGNLVALLGVDMSAAEMLRQERAVLQAVLIGLLISLVVSAVLARFYATAFCRPILALADGTRRVSGGELETEVEVRGPREVVGLAESFNLMTRALREQNERLVQLSNTDYLTGLRNHRYLQERLEQEIRRALRYRRPLSLVMLDLDLLRRVNAVHGHQGGDDILRQMAQIIRSTIRECDVAARYGGEEFALIMPDASAAQAYQAAERLRRAIEDATFRIRSLSGQLTEIRITVSQGVAECPKDSRERNGLVAAADLALFRAKHASRNRVCTYSDDEGTQATQVDPGHIHRAVRDASLAAVKSLASALEARDHYTRGHSENVTDLAVATAEAMGLGAETVLTLRTAGLLHDVGKLGIPDEVLHKQTQLTEQEWELIRAHPAVGASLLSSTLLPQEIVPVVEHHHEHYDGTGYPHGAAGDEIPLTARILAVADAYDAMTSPRPYRPAMTHEQALAELRAQAGAQFDPEVVKVFGEIAGRVAERPSAVIAAQDALPGSAVQR